MSAAETGGGVRTIGVGVVGAGFMGRAHLAAYAAARAAGAANRVVAISGRGLEENGLSGNGGTARGNLGLELDVEALGLGEALLSEDPRAVLEHPEVDAVSICTPTDTHVALAQAALAAGKHVLVEKPVALASGDVERLIAAARAAGRVCMPAMCMRFWPGWDWLRERVVDGTLGRATSAVFRRLGSRPDWSRDFYEDVARSGGALFDLHVHDVDFVRYLFGEPSAVHAGGSRHHVVATYGFDGGPDVVVAEGGWDHAPGFPFRMEYTVVFENATAEFVLGRDPVLTLAQDGEVRPVPVGEGNGYDGEVAAFLDAVAGSGPDGAPSLEDALAVTRILEQEARAIG